MSRDEAEVAPTLTVRTLHTTSKSKFESSRRNLDRFFILCISMGEYKLKGRRSNSLAEANLERAVSSEIETR